MYINPSWNYNEIVNNLKTLRLRYEEVLASFSHVREENNFIRETRNNLYAMNLEEFQKDRIWEYMNGYLSSLNVFILFGIWEDDDEEYNKFIN